MSNSSKVGLCVDTFPGPGKGEKRLFARLLQKKSSRTTHLFSARREQVRCGLPFAKSFDMRERTRWMLTLFSRNSTIMSQVRRVAVIFHTYSLWERRCSFCRRFQSRQAVTVHTARASIPGTRLLSNVITPTWIPCRKESGRVDLCFRTKHTEWCITSMAVNVHVLLPEPLFDLKVGAGEE
jgi:hypothetical protein